MNNRFAALCLIMAGFFVAGCAKEPLTKEKAQELIEASHEFQPSTTQVTLTPEEIENGRVAGYWSINGIKRSDSTLALPVIILTSIGAAYFRGAPIVAMPVMKIQQDLGERVIEITKIEDDPKDSKQKNVEFTWIRRFENQIPELADFFKDQPAQKGTKKFVYGKNGWEIKP